ncbi:hypothetical protein CKO51_12180 [Rhodopirellula sp. SM50]|nr:hypothetical protein CKO51_12180 [Rhodopirellula sp. SM50]
MAGGPFWQSDGQGALGTHGSLDAPPIEVSGGVDVLGTGVRQGGGAAGSGNAGAGNENGRVFKGSPSFRRQFPSRPSPAEPGSAIVVVAGRGLKIRCPVGSMAGSRSREQPTDCSSETNATIAIILAIALNFRHPQPSRAVAGEVEFENKANISLSQAHAGIRFGSESIQTWSEEP